MTPIQSILKMIETVDPADTAKLDEIDARVWCYVREFVFEHSDSNFVKANGLLPHLGFSKYTRSRDALKSIRPKKVHFKIYNLYKSDLWLADKGWEDAFVAVYTIHRNGFTALCNQFEPLPTEELAELHAIIQAIKYDREKK